jgi:hypothetical protein
MSPAYENDFDYILVPRNKIFIIQGIITIYFKVVFSQYDTGHLSELLNYLINEIFPPEDLFRLWLVHV